LPPTLEQLEVFLADERPDAYSRLVDRLLASPHYGQRWGQHWLDVVRFGESRGYERNEIINNLWPFRDYIIRSLNEDKPFDQLVHEHLAGDVLGPDDRQLHVGSAFLVCGTYDDVGNQDAAQAAQIRANTLDDIIRATGEAFLGLTIGCARCHDHKFDPILQRDYYQWYATFAGVEHGTRELATDEERHKRSELVEPLKKRLEEIEQQGDELRKRVLARAREDKLETATPTDRPAVSRTGTEEQFDPVLAHYVRLVCEGTDVNPAARTGFRIDELEVWTAESPARNVALESAGGVATGASPTAEDFAGAYSSDLAIDGQFGACWIAAEPTLTVKLNPPATVDRVYFSSDRTGAAGSNPVANFVSDYRIEVSTDGSTWNEVAQSFDRQPLNDRHREHRLLQRAMDPAERELLADLEREADSINERLHQIPALAAWWVGSRKPVTESMAVFLGGSPQRKGESVVPASLSTLDRVTRSYRLDASAAEGDRRLALARWLTSTDNPLTLRVIANRLWQHHFGRGIVETPNDFGYMGARPSHPELLDYLAHRLIENGWRWKPLHREIMLSSAYQQSSAFRADAAAVDSDARWLWRFPPRRLDAEEIRDTMLQVSGLLDRRMGGPGFRLYRYLQDNVATYIPLEHHDASTYRRAVYHQSARATRIDLFTDFDCPDNTLAAPRRTQTVTALQALTLMNHDFTIDMSQALAARVRREVASDDPAALANATVRQVFQRPCDPAELEQAAAFVARHGLPAFCRVLFNTSELIYVD
jgi:hypothetical protein